MLSIDFIANKSKSKGKVFIQKVAQTLIGCSKYTVTAFGKKKWTSILVTLVKLFSYLFRRKVKKMRQVLL